MVRLSWLTKQSIMLRGADVYGDLIGAVRMRAGLISAAPGRRNSGQQASAKQVEHMVRAKMEQREYIILCLEDSNDWSNATSRRMVMQVPAARREPSPLLGGVFEEKWLLSSKPHAAC